MRIRSDLLRPALLPLAGAVLFLAMAAMAAPARGSASLAGGAGIGYQYPRDREISDLYGPGPSFHGLVEARLEGFPLALAAEIGYFRVRADRLSAPFFVSDAEGTLRLIPLDLVARLPLSRGTVHPHLGAGLEVLWTKETFSYRLDGGARKRDPASRFDPGVIVVAGFERSTAPRLRFEGYLTAVPVRKWVSARDAYEPSGAHRFDAGSAGARILWRLP